MGLAAFNEKSVTRLFRYRRALLRFQGLGYQRIVSSTLGHEVGVSASQVRKDFSVFGISGNKKGGYRIDALLATLESILGKNKIHELIIVGVGNIGRALINFRDYEKEGLRILAGFDIDPSKINRKSLIPVLPAEEMRPYVEEKKIKAAIIAVPDISAQSVCDMLVGAGIRGILNFAPIRLKVPVGIIVYNANIYSKLENIFYFMDGFGGNPKETGEPQDRMRGGSTASVV